ERTFGAHLAPVCHHGRSARAGNPASTLLLTWSVHETGWRPQSAASTTTARTIPTEGGRGWSVRGSNCPTSSRNCACACLSNDLGNLPQQRLQPRGRKYRCAGEGRTAS